MIGHSSFGFIADRWGRRFTVPIVTVLAGAMFATLGLVRDPTLLLVDGFFLAMLILAPFSAGLNSVQVPHRGACHGLGDYLGRRRLARRLRAAGRRDDTHDCQGLSVLALGDDLDVVSHNVGHLTADVRDARGSRCRPASDREGDSQSVGGWARVRERE